MSQYHESAVDRAVREAQERGEFDDLPGAGKPLELGSPNDPDWWIKGLIQREQLDMSAALPSGIALRREIERLPATLVDVAREEHARAIVEDLNRRVLEDRTRPTTGPTVLAPTVDVESVIAQWRATRQARYAPLAGGVPATHDEAPEARAVRGGWLRRWLRRG